jgi:hypothetical protein
VDVGELNMEIIGKILIGLSILGHATSIYFAVKDNKQAFSWCDIASRQFLILGFILLF